MILERAGANSEQIKYWNEISGPKWVKFHEVLEIQLARFGERVMERAGLAAGERVLDVGCGCGGTTLELARRVGRAGRVVGVDVSTAMLELAIGSARSAGLANVHFENADAQTFPFPPEEFDLVYSRFGVMFFADPGAAFANLGRALRAGGRLAFVCWQPLAKNPWLLIPLGAAAKHLTLQAPADPEAPGPFSFGDENRVRRILCAAGFADLHFEEANETLAVGGGAGFEQAIEFVLQMGPLGAACREAAPEVRERVAVDVREALLPFHGHAGVRMGSSAWIVTARR